MEVLKIASSDLEEAPQVWNVADVTQGQTAKFRQVNAAVTRNETTQNRRQGQSVNRQLQKGSSKLPFIVQGRILTVGRREPIVIVSLEFFEADVG